MLELLAGQYSQPPVFRSFERIADAPFRLFSNSTVTFGDGIYVVGGTGGPTAPTGQATSKATMFFNVKTGVWTRKADVPDDILRAPICVHNGLIWVMGTTKMMTYNPATDAWVVQQNIGFVIRSARMFGYGDYLYIFGGELNGGSITDVFRRYHIPSATFENVPSPVNLPFGRGYYGGTQVGTKFYMYGGYRPSNQPPSGQFSQFWVYDLPTNTWEALPTAFDVAMHTHQIAHCAGSIITGGAWSNAPSSGQLFEYNIAQRRWQRGLKIPYSGWWLLFDVVGDEGFLMGGSGDATPGGSTPQIWKLSR